MVPLVRNLFTTCEPSQPFRRSKHPARERLTGACRSSRILCLAMGSYQNTMAFWGSRRRVFVVHLDDEVLRLQLATLQGVVDELRQLLVALRHLASRSHLAWVPEMALAKASKTLKQPGSSGRELSNSTVSPRAPPWHLGATLPHSYP